jgi:hypothetical protein
MKKTISARAVSPQLEALESRLLLSGGTVQVLVVAKVLDITGDSASNHISIAQTGLGDYTIAGLDGTLVKTGANGTPAASQQVTGATKDIAIDMSVGAVDGNAGNDIVELASDLHVGVDPATLQGTRGSITFKGSAGDDQLLLGGTAATASAVFNANPADDNTIQITDALGVTKTLEFDTGALHNAGDIPVAIGANAGATMTNFLTALKGSTLHISEFNTSTGGVTSSELLSIAGTAGNQPIVVTSANIAATNFTGGVDYLLDALNVTATMGDGGNVLALGSLSTTPANFASTIHGNLSVTAGKGDNLTVSANVCVHGNLTASLGAGDNLLTVASTEDTDGEALGRVDGSLKYSGGVGDDFVDMENGEVGGSVTDDAGSSTNTGKDGIDADGTTIGGGVTIAYMSTGDAHVDLVSAAMDNSLSVTTGAGDDTVNLSGADIVGKTTLNLGVGNNTLNAGQNSGVIAIFEGPFAFTATSLANSLNSINLQSADMDSTMGVTTGASNDSVDMSGALVSGNVSLNLGAGNNSFLATGATAANFWGNVGFMATGGGNNTVTVGTTSGMANIIGGLKIATGSGNDTIGFDANILGNLSLNTGTSLTGDTITGSGGTVTGTAGISMGNTAGTSAINLLNTTFINSTALRLGLGTNNVDVEGSEFCRRNGTFSLTGGIGVDNISFAADVDYARPTTFWRGVNVHLGGGSDTLKIGASTVAGGTGDANTYARFLSALGAPAFYAGAGTNHIYYQLENDTPGLTIANQFLLTPVINTFFLF